MRELRQEMQSADATLNSKALSHLDQHFIRYVDQGTLPGFLLPVARKGRVAHLTLHGSRNRAAGPPAETDTVWRMHSMTKPVTSVAAPPLSEHGAPDLDAPRGTCRPTSAAP